MTGRRMKVFRLGVMSCKFIYIDIIILNRHPESALSADRLGSGSQNEEFFLDDVFLNQVQNDVQTKQHHTQRYKTMVNRHPELDSGSTRHLQLDEMLKQVQHDAQRYSMMI